MNKIITYKDEEIENLYKPSEPIILLENNTPKKDEAKEIIAKLNEIFENDNNIIALSAPQIGINKRVFGIRFSDSIKYFINPITTKKEKYDVAIETDVTFPDLEILVCRPSKIIAVYFNENFKYENNKFLGLSAKIFNRMCDILDGVLPNTLGPVWNPLNDGSLLDYDYNEILELYDHFIEGKKEEIENIKNNLTDTEKKIYENINFSESVINGKTILVEDEKQLNREQRRKIEKQKRKNKRK